MSQEYESSSDEEWIPNVNFYLSNPRSTKLRELSMDIIARMNTLSRDQEVGKSTLLQQRFLGELASLDEDLQELGITQGMKSDLSLQEYQMSPVHCTEWIAGQLRKAMKRKIISETEIAPIVQELNLLDIPQEPLIDIESMPKKLYDFMIQRRFIANVEHMLVIPKPAEEDLT